MPFYHTYLFFMYQFGGSIYSGEENLPAGLGDSYICFHNGEKFLCFCNGKISQNKEPSDFGINIDVTSNPNEIFEYLNASLLDCDEILEFTEDFVLEEVV